MDKVGEPDIRTTIENFRTQFLGFHRDLKIKILKWQVQALENQKYDSSQSDYEAKRCFVPMIKIRDEAQSLIQNDIEKYQACVQEAIANNASPNLCVEQFKQDLDVQKPKLISLYEEKL